MSDWPKEWKKCPVCGGEETVSQLATRHVFKGHGGPTAIERKLTQITSPGKLSLVPKAVVVMMDICAECGANYCRRAEIVEGRLVSAGAESKMN
jgi:hypothetical protein